MYYLGSSYLTKWKVEVGSQNHNQKDRILLTWVSLWLKYTFAGKGGWFILIAISMKWKISLNKKEKLELRSRQHLDEFKLGKFRLIKHDLVAESRVGDVFSFVRSLRLCEALIDKAVDLNIDFEMVRNCVNKPVVVNPNEYTEGEKERVEREIRKTFLRHSKRNSTPGWNIHSLYMLAEDFVRLVGFFRKKEGKGEIPLLKERFAKMLEKIDEGFDIPPNEMICYFLTGRFEDWWQ